mgnify:CR=1 FL=1
MSTASSTEGTPDGWRVQNTPQAIVLVNGAGDAGLIVRLVPSAPFIVVNMAAGVTPMRLSHFIAGTGIGIVPKIALTAFAGASIVQLMRGEIGRHWIELAVVAALWLAIGWFARLWLQRRGD